MDFKSEFGVGLVVTWLVSVLVSLAIPVALICVAIHFIHKLW